MLKYFIRAAVPISLILMFAGWGPVGHKIMNSNIIVGFPAAMNLPAYWSDSLAAHSSDPDNRKSIDPTETFRHYIIIDKYPEFVSGGFINQSYETNVTLHGSSFVNAEGLIPWAIQWTVDSLRAAFQQKDWHKAMLLCADIGHYAGDSHHPMHLSSNYNGQLTNQSGVTFRIDSLVEQYVDSIKYTNDPASYISDISSYVFDYIYTVNKDISTLLYADSIANFMAGSTTGAVYSRRFWEMSGFGIIKLMKAASKSAADLIYTAWVDAGSPDPNVTSIKDEQVPPSSFKLYQNYPNPFNPVTSIRFNITAKGNVTLRVYDVNGRRIAELLNGEKEAGNYEVKFDASKLSSGVYFCQLSTAGYCQSKKLVLMK